MRYSKGAQAGHRGAQRGNHVGTNADHGLRSIDQGRQARQGFAQGGRLLEREKQVAPLGLSLIHI